MKKNTKRNRHIKIKELSSRVLSEKTIGGTRYHCGSDDDTCNDLTVYVVGSPRVGETIVIFQ